MSDNKINNSVILISILFRPFLFSMPFFFTLTMLSAEPVFRDDFSSPYLTLVSWLLNDPQNSSMTISDQNLNLKNLHQYNSVIALHSLPQKYPSFTISTTILSESAGSGLFFNVATDQAGKINGYGTLLSFDKVEVVKFASGTHTTLASNTSTFIKPYDNVLTISKKDSLMMIFCNGYFLYSCIDGELPAGDIALIVQPRSSTLFGDFEFLSTPLDSLTFKPFIDNFDKPAIFGWRKSGSGIATNVDSALEMRTNSFQQFLYTINQPMNSFQLETDICQQNVVNSDSSRCGVVLTAYINNNFDSISCILIGFDHQQNLTITGITGTEIIKPASEIYRQDLTWKRLKLIYENSVLQFFCDDRTCIQLFTPLSVNSAGLFSSKGPVVRFDNFSLKGGGYQVSEGNNHRFLSNNISAIHSSDLSYSVLWSDLLGRSCQIHSGTPKCAASLFVNNLNQKKIFPHCLRNNR
ncbi:MAG TPA: hypothetical protein VHO70_20930 [Chitinispirillaceae bacterium]|nr:hypothetical protein [Chitinispirillaceae bacterium]